MENLKNSNLTVLPPSLPKGGGSLKGMGENLSSPGSDGMANFIVPLPITKSRYLSPDLALSYNSGVGNGSFGMGWSINTTSISRRTTNGIPKYKNTDEFIGPNGEVLVPECDKMGQVINRKSNNIKGMDLKEMFMVTKYLSRKESNFDQIEYWEPNKESSTLPFWVIYTSNGELHCFGKQEQARIASPNDKNKIAKWFLEESISPFGEHIYYNYKQDYKNERKVKNFSNNNFNSYLKSIHYGNKIASSKLYILDEKAMLDNEWLYTLVLDYGEHCTPITIPSPYYPYGNWSVRKDSFSRFDYGFEIRTNRLCRQVLMFHNFKELGTQPYLVWRMKLEYDENEVASTLCSIHQLSYETDGSINDMPPLEFFYSEFEIRDNIKWNKYMEAPELKNLYNYQLVDLYGEGISGILYQNNSNWYYRSATRDTNSDFEDQITYDSLTSLSTLPIAKENGMLIDFNGDGNLDWIITKPGFAGSYKINSDKTLEQFVPFKALPNEFFHPYAQLSNVTGSPFNDLLMIGPNSVRFYKGDEFGFGNLEEFNTKLPFNRNDDKELIAFSDILGSGQQHIVLIRHDGVICFANIGLGKFGKGVKIPGFFISEKEFDPKRIYLADIDGSGTSDLLYVKHDKILIYRNLSGNRFAKPLEIPLPEGVYFDNFCSIILADVRGVGVTDIILHIPYKKPGNWHLKLSEVKPYLLKSVHNNIGSISQISYRSSAQYWLDEKNNNPLAVPCLPFPINIVSSIKIIDEHTGYFLEKHLTYKRGVYDKQERAYAGFGYIEVIEKQKNKEGEILKYCPPIKTCTWYHTGRKEDERIATLEYFRDDPDIFILKSTNFSKFSYELDSDVLLSELTKEQSYWLYSTLRGTVLRIETYSLENDIPYNIESYRYQVRMVQNIKNYYITLLLQLEQLFYNYEQIKKDPQCTQQINQWFDVYGFARQEVTINYPRREKSSNNLHIGHLPDCSLSSSYDIQQFVLRLTRQRQSFYHLEDFNNWKLGIPHKSRSDVFTYKTDVIPDGGIYSEILNNEGLLFTPTESEIFGGQQEIIYLNEDVPDIRALPYFVRTSVFDDASLKAYDNILNKNELELKLNKAGFQITPKILDKNKEETVFASETGFTYYSDSDNFYHVIATQSSKLTSKQIFTWDDYNCVIVQVKDDLNNKSSFFYDYRFLVPDINIDINENTTQVKLDSFGRVMYKWYFGEENGQTVGFIKENSFTPPKTVEEALNLLAPISVANINLYETNSFMGSITLDKINNLDQDSEKLWNKMVKNKIIMSDGRILTRGRNLIFINKLLPNSVVTLLNQVIRKPIHEITLTPNNYPNYPTQQINRSITFYDGFGRVIQSSHQSEDGLAYVQDESSKLILTKNFVPTEEETNFRWIISDRYLYSTSGEVIFAFKPFFLNTWNYVDNISIYKNIIKNTYYYDGLSRKISEVNANGYENKISYYPWFTVNEDENDTVEGTLFSKTPTISVVDNRNLPIKILEYNRKDINDPIDEYITINNYTLLGHLESSVDPRFSEQSDIVNFINIYTLQGEVIYTNSIDSGKNVKLINVDGQLIWFINANNIETEIIYDVLGRKLAVYENNIHEKQKCSERFIYGDNYKNAHSYNLRGKLICHYDTAGLIKFESYTISGMHLMENRQLKKDLDNPSDWKTEYEIDWKKLLEDEEYITYWRYNALGQVTWQLDAKGNEHNTTFNILGQIKTKTIKLKDLKEENIYKNIIYNASGQKIYTELGNGVITKYKYEIATDRLIDMITKRPQNNNRMKVLQSLHFEYDRVGNIISEENRVEKNQYFKNQEIKPKRTFTYDALYQLICATGRESDENIIHNKFQY